MKNFQNCLFSFFLVATYVCSSEKLEYYTNEEDGKLNMTQIITKYGFPAESHEVQTEDGYILTIFRIPPGSHCGNETKKLPIIIQHGLLSSSYDFVTNGPSNSLSFILAKKCYDVWLGNCRGNEFGRKHVTLKPNDPKFWEFSWHEVGYYDVPAVVDHILKTSNQTELHFLGYSQGTTVSYVFGSTHPEYHSKIKSLHSLSPIAFMKNLKNPMIKILSIFAQPLEILARLIGLNDLQPTFDLIHMIGSETCSEKYPDLLDLCLNMNFLFFGFDEPQLNRTFMSSYLGHTPSSAAVRQLIHYAQLIQSGAFRQFDFGVYKNLEVYNSMFPTDYNLSAINIPTALYFGQSDNMASVEDVAELEKRLPNVVEFYEVPYSKFTHSDFVLAIDIRILLYNKILEVLKRFE